MKKILIAMLLVGILLLVGCFEHAGSQGTGVDSGDFITPDDMEEISRELEESNSTSPMPEETMETTEAIDTTTLVDTTTVYAETIAPDVVTTLEPEVTTTVFETTQTITEVTTVSPPITTVFYETTAPIVAPDDTTVVDFPDDTTAVDTTTVSEPLDVPTEPETTTDGYVDLPVVPLGGATSSSDSSNADAEVYWTPGGEVWHVTSECSSLSRSTTILNGSIDEAQAAGKSRACKRCG